MAFKTKRQARYDKLRRAGFLPFEARPLSRIPLKDVPYMRQLVTDRQEMLKGATRQKLTQKEYEARVKQIYIDGEFTSISDRGDTVLDPWKLLHKKEEDYIAKHPDYESPWKKRRRGWKNFARKFEQTVEKQRENI